MALDLPGVFENVLSFLPTASLVACTLVCQSWRSSTLSTLLRAITLRHRDAATALLRTLLSHREWPRFIRALDLASGPSFRNDVVTPDQMLAISRVCPHVSHLVLRKLSAEAMGVVPEMLRGFPDLRSLKLSVTRVMLSHIQTEQPSLSELLVHIPKLQELSLTGVVLSVPPSASPTSNPAPSLRKVHLFAARIHGPEIIWLLSHSRDTLTSLRLVNVDLPHLVAAHSYGTAITSNTSGSPSFSVDEVAQALDLLGESVEHLVLGLNPRLLDRRTTASALSRGSSSLQTIGLPLETVSWGLLLDTPQSIREIDLFLLPHLSTTTVRDAIDALARCRIPTRTSHRGDCTGSSHAVS